MSTLSALRDALKVTLDAIAIVLMSPLSACCALEWRLVPDSERIFNTCAQTVALLPGLPGMILRRGFYRAALDSCARDSFIGFGAIFTHRAVVVEPHVYIGPYALIASSRLREGCLIGSRASILSGGGLHSLGPSGRWLPSDMSKMVQVEIGAGAWICEGAIVFANIGSGSMVAAGSVVGMQVLGGMLVGGNPARMIRRLEPPVERAESEDRNAALASVR
jgi:virginiamycin A acetyltransferase